MSYIKQLCYLVFESNRQAEWNHYFTDFLGMDATTGDDGTVYARMDGNAHRFLVTPGDSEDLYAAGYLVSGPKEFDAFANHLKSNGVEINFGSAADAQSRNVENMFWFLDPEGLRIEIVYNPLIQKKTFISSKNPGGFVTDDQGLGHIAICVADLELCEKFYKDVLGFKLSDYIVQDIQGIPIRFTFFHVNPRHHTLALAGIPQAKRMNHFMVQVANVDVVGQALERAKEMEIPIYMELGRHPNDRMLSFYAKTPSDSSVEVGCEGLEIRDEQAWEIRTYDAISEWGHKF